MILTAAAFELDVTVVFLDEAVSQLLGGQDTVQSGEKNVGNMLSALAFYDVEKVFVHSPSADRFGLQAIDVPGGFERVDDNTLASLVNQAGQVLVF